MPAHAEFAQAFSAALRGGPVPDCVDAVDPAETARRFAVYRNNVAHGLSRALAARFPAIERLVGAPFFAAMAQEFIGAHPPRSPILQDWGAEMPRFLAQFPPAQSLFYLPDVAQIEWARGCAYHAADAAPIAHDRLQAAALSDAGHLRLILHPSVQILQLATPGLSIWAAQQPGGPAAPAPQDWRPEHVLIARRATGAVVERPISPQQALFFAGLLGRESLAQAVKTAGPGFDTAQAIALLLSDGLVVDLNITKGNQHAAR